MKLPKYIMLFVAFMTSIVCYAHKVLFNTLPFLEELPTNSIFTLYQDNTGYIWIGTGDGLARYDGYSATWLSNNFSYPNRLQNNDTRCFTEDDRYIWASSTSGITLIDKTNLSTHILNSDEIRGDINDLLNDGKGTVWIATENGVYCYDLNQKFKQKYTLSQGVKSLFKDNNGYMWATGNIGLVAKYDSKSDKFIEMPSLGDEIIARMAQTSDGLYWLSTWGDGIWTFNPNASNRDAIYRHVKVMNPIRGAEEKVFFDIVQDDTFGYIWALSHFKLYIFKPDGKGGLTEINSDEISQVKGNIDLYKSYSKIMKDRMGNLWLAAFDSGYTVHFPDQRIDNHIFSDMNSALGLDPNVLYLNKDSNGIIWFDQARYGICLYDETTGRNSYSNARDNNFYNIDVGLFCPSHTPGIMWLGGRERSDNKVWKASAENMHVKLLEEYDLSSSQSGNTYLMGIIEDSEGNLYVATTRYVACLNNGEGKFKKYVDGFEDILSMDNACSNQLCVTCKSSINIVNTESQKVVKKISLDDILSSDELITNSCVMCDSLVWLSTGLGRILCANIQNENITDHTSKLDSPKGRILNLVSDGDSILYAITNKSIISLNIHNPSNNYIYSVYDDDINLTSFRYGGAFVDNDKSLYVGGHKGFIRIFSDNPRHAQATDKNLYITDIVADGKSLFFDLDAESNDNSFTEVKIEPSQKNIEIHFSNFIHGLQNRCSI